MADTYSGTPLDGLLRIVLELGGDRLHLGTGKAPEALAGARPLRLTLPATSSSMLRALCGPMAQRHRQGGGQRSAFSYSAEGESFEVQIEGDLDDEGAASVLVMRSSAGAAPSPQRGTPGPDPALRPERALRAPANSSASRVGGERLEVSGAPVVKPQRFPETVGNREGAEEGSVLATESADRGGCPPALANLVEMALTGGASDLHLCAGDLPMMRVAGRLRPMSGASPYDPLAMLTEPQRKQVLGGEALDWAMSGENAVRLRVNVFLSESGVCAAIRMLRSSPPALRALGLPEEVLALTTLPSGLVLFCGQTGAGKSTSLAALTEDLLGRGACHCITLESPIEYLLSAGRNGSRVRQREVGRHVSSFSAGVRDSLREDPDFLLIGEMRDAETIALALTAAETGRLVLSSLHCRSAVGAIERILDAFTGDHKAQVRGQLAESLRAVVSQRLLPTARGDGRVLAAEVLTVTPAVAHLIREGKTPQILSAMQSGKQAGMLPIEHELARLVKSGRVQRAVARAAAVSFELFDQLC